GRATVLEACRSRRLRQYSQAPPRCGTEQDPEPDYLLPDPSCISLAPARIRLGNSVPAGQPAGVVQGITIWNHSAITRDVYVYFPGKYTTTLNVPDKPKGDPLTSLYIFMNGIYYF